ncbi:MAG: TIGR00645 family protein [Gammaproteobacteria bacterium]
MNSIMRTLANIIFFGRWLQAPLYLGLILVLGAYVYKFGLELVDLMQDIKHLTDTSLMLGVLDLIDVVMIANLLIMVIMGGYETFVSRLNLHNNPDQPEWLDEVNAGTMKIKLSIALIGISSIHLLRTFIDPSKFSNFSVMWQVIIHLTLVASAVFIAITNKIMISSKNGNSGH